MKILEAEIALRAETRVAEQSRTAVEAADYKTTAERLETTQDGLRQRVDDVIDRIEDLPNPSDFGKEIRLLSAVSDVMYEATEILGLPDTGPPAIAAETEAIELLLQAKRSSGQGGGGGGTTPSASGRRSGDTDTPALALVGEGDNLKGREGARDVSQMSGEVGASFPEEFRSGLDEYFKKLENER